MMGVHLTPGLIIIYIVMCYVPVERGRTRKKEKRSCNTQVPIVLMG